MNQSEQYLAIKNWLRKIAWPTVIGVTIGGGVIGGWQWWQYEQRQHSSEASVAFDTLHQAIKEGNAKKSRQLTEELNTEYHDTPYASGGRLLLAKMLYAIGKPEHSVEQLQLLLNSEPEQVVREIAANRLARILIDLQRPDEALEVIAEQLNQILGRSATTYFYIIQADAYATKKQYEAARNALQTARRNLPEHSPLKELIDLKFKNIALLKG